MHRAPRAVTALVAALLISTITIVGATAATAAPEAGVPVVHIDGRGHGHGVGLSQWGAYTMGTQGHTAADIIATFYPGTQLGSAEGNVIVVVDTRPSVRVSLPQGGEIRSARDGAQAEGFPIKVAPGEVVTVSHDGSSYVVHGVGGVRGAASTRQRYRAAQEPCVLLCGDPGEPDEGDDPDGEPGDDPDEGSDGCLLCTTTTTTPPPPPDDADPSPGAPPPTTPPSSTPPSTEPAPAPGGDAHRSPTPIWAIPNGGGTVTVVDRGRSYRGAMELMGGPGEIRARNHVHVEDYLRGMAEVPGHWPPAAVQAQTIAARTYVLRAMAAGGEICDSESCQVYSGVAHESAGQDAAVAATRGLVVTYQGRLAATFYSASGGGFSATVSEGFGADYDIPYLQARPYETSNPKVWQVDVALADVAARLDYPGTITGVTVAAAGPSGRALTMVLDGDSGTMEIDPQDFRRRLGLQSTLFTVETAVADAAPPPPPPPVEADQLTTAGGPSRAATVDSQLAGLLGASTDLEASAPRVEDFGPVPDTQQSSSLPVSIAVAVLAAVAVALCSHLLGTRRLVPVGSSVRRFAATLHGWIPRRRRPGPSCED